MEVQEVQLTRERDVLDLSQRNWRGIQAGSFCAVHNTHAKSGSILVSLD